jgi:hypothetical protein
MPGAVTSLSITMLDAARVREVLPMAACIDAMVVAMRGTSDGSIAMPLRTVLPLADGSGSFLVMPGAVPPRIYGAKLVGLHPGNPAQGRPAVQGFVMLFDHASGAPLALLDGGEITARRTAGRERSRDTRARTPRCRHAGAARMRRAGGRAPRGGALRARHSRGSRLGARPRERTRVCVTSRRGGVRDADRRRRRGRGRPPPATSSAS